MPSPVDLVVPVKGLSAAKSRLRGAADGGAGDPGAHGQLTLALLLDTLGAARRSGVRRLLVVSSDPDVAAAVGRIAAVTTPAVIDSMGDGGDNALLQVLPEGPAPGLNAALAHGAAVLRGEDPSSTVGALQADLPALRPDELRAALAEAVARFADGAVAAFCADTPGDGTTLLLAAPGTALAPAFGPGSASRHAAAGAVPVGAALPGLRRDVDTPADLRHAVALGVGPHTAAALPVVARGA
ncbi:2-phospho-L-lactate guanylyltransferase [Pseudonocardia sp. N23]|uniref:2-phospho-L-lactate guanylyltransferase n=1 Tax=Pseudonocardia sp. N23 TaxID=1987376 RepID=UPI000BFD47C9|nr:2-phospho-L-lactate guanylyltransferase [Pseudonocardia sp. N23]GAY12265.1 2-phospho-L-lactate guanylyltransferase [Pseudonocardia sp. N23]